MVMGKGNERNLKEYGQRVDNFMSYVTITGSQGVGALICYGRWISV
jgi:hypothetical protein